MPDILGLVWPSFRPTSGSKSKIPGRILKSFPGPFSGDEGSFILVDIGDLLSNESGERARSTSDVEDPTRIVTIKRDPYRHSKIYVGELILEPNSGNIHMKVN